MGIKSLSKIIKNLLDNGRAPETPVAIIQWGTMPHQKIVYSKLRSVEEVVKKEKISPPGVIVVGEVVNLGKKLNWFEKKKLFGKKILITRAEEQAGSFISLIEKSGGIPIITPAIETVPPESWDSLDRGIDIIDSYHWIIFTSVNAVKYFFERLRSKEKDIRELKGVKICSIGVKTADAVKSYGLTIDLVPEKSVAESVVDSFSKFSIEGMRFFMPRAKEARDVIPEALRKNNAVIDIGIAYQTVSAAGKSDYINGLLERDEIDVLTFTSSSTVTNFMKMADINLIKKSAKIVIASIGPITAESVVKLGLKNDIIAPLSTIESLTDSIEKYFSQKEELHNG
jgi:uroporphyrinogen III methyltransferase/synthase